ncbi:MAG TPA: alpha-amylase family glycosyl hydrolase [Anaerolineales bacterium]|nr:alpha-amylase family glycosyl hydrolase [Anaerolineales bacterium]
MEQLPYLSSIHHGGSSRYVHPNSHHLGDAVTIRLRTAITPHIQQVLLRTVPDGEQHFAALQMVDRRMAGACQWWKVSLSITIPVTTYRFLIITDEGTYWYNASGLHTYNPTDFEDFKLLADYQSPTWLKEAVFYQIFPDRFADGDPSTNVRDGEYEYAGYKARARSWGEAPNTSGRAAMVEFYGGDLAGIKDHLDYLSDLGVNALYLNPIFSALSNHRYDVTDYFSVDAHLGGNQALVDLRQALTQRGMHYILDIVPNHCGIMHPWFQAALADPNAPTADYFTFRKHPDDYETWLGVRTLVKLNYRSAALREVMYAGKQAVFRHWLRPPYSADGWRIDVANMLARQGVNQLGMEVGRGIRQAVKDENSQAYLMGENFFDATTQLQGDCWDGVMNYAGFALPIRDWLGPVRIYVPGQAQWVNTGNPLTTQALVDSWTAFKAGIPWVVATQQYNLIGSHDTPRALSLLGGNPDLFRMVVALLFTYPGIPSVYYGDEIGLGGGQGLYSRQCMNWNPAAWDLELQAYYRKLIHLRRSAPALIDGGFQVLWVEADTLVFQRDTENQVVLVAAQRGTSTRPAGPIPVSHAAIPDGTQFAELFTGNHATVQEGYFPLPALAPGAQIWISRNQ